MTSQAYTYADHAYACREAAQRLEVLEAWVQVKTSGVAHCARLLGPWTSPDHVDFWQVQSLSPLPFKGCFPVRSVRQCSGLDGRCFCGSAASEAAALDRAKLAPHVSGAVAQPSTPQGVTCL